MYVPILTLAAGPTVSRSKGVSEEMCPRGFKATRNVPAAVLDQVPAVSPSQGGQPHPGSLGTVVADTRPHVPQVLGFEGSPTQAVSFDAYVTLRRWRWPQGGARSREAPQFPFYRMRKTKCNAGHMWGTGKVLEKKHPESQGRLSPPHPSDSGAPHSQPPSLCSSENTVSTCRLRGLRPSVSSSSTSLLSSGASRPSS